MNNEAVPYMPVVGDTVLVSVKYQGPSITYQDGRYYKSKGRPIGYLDFVLNDCYYRPIVEILKDKLKFGYYRFTYSGGDLYADLAPDEIHGTISNQPVTMEVTQKLQDVLTNGDWSAIEKAFAKGGGIISSVIVRRGVRWNMISNPKSFTTRRGYDHIVLLTDFLNNVNPGVLNNVPNNTANRDKILVKCSVELMIDYLSKTEYDCRGVLGELPSHLQNSDPAAKAKDLIGDWRLDKLLADNPVYYGLLTFISATFRGKPLPVDRMINQRHLDTYTKIKAIIKAKSLAG